MINMVKNVNNTSRRVQRGYITQLIVPTQRKLVIFKLVGVSHFNTTPMAFSLKFLQPPAAIKATFTPVAVRAAAAAACHRDQAVQELH
jgi:hypothetical protein